MTQDEIIRMAREAGMTVFVIESLERFSALVAAHEREKCADLCSNLANYTGTMLADKIRTLK